MQPDNNLNLTENGQMMETFKRVHIDPQLSAISADLVAANPVFGSMQTQSECRMEVKLAHDLG